MKKIFVLLLALTMVFSMSACGGTGADKSGSSSAGKIDNAVDIKEGTTAVEEGLDLKGKTITYAIAIPLTDNMKRQVAAFEKKYGCTVKTDLLGFTNYVQLLGSKISSGNTYDIIQVEGVRFPNIAIAGFCEPLEDIVTTADFGNVDDKSKGGFDKELSNSFKWGGHLYGVVGVAGEFSPHMNVMYYNKKILSEAGAEDPRELYEKGEWDFDAFYRVGTQVRDAFKSQNIYMCYSQMLYASTYWNGVQTIDESNPAEPKANLTNEKMVNAFKFLQKCAYGANAIAWFGDDSNGTRFIQGKDATFVGFDFDLYQNVNLGSAVTNSNAFGKNIENLGIVPCPQGPDNKEGKNIVGSWLYAIGAGRGTSDPRIAMAFAKFSTTYKQVNISKYKYSAEDQKLIDKLTNGPKIWNNASYADGTNVAYLQHASACWDIMSGKDISQTVEKYNKTIQNCIDVAISQQ